MLSIRPLLAIAALAAAALAHPSQTSQQAAPAYSDIVIYHHNIHRQNHSVGNVRWDAGLAATASTIASTCVFKHQSINGGGYGQNLAAGISPQQVSKAVTDLWYNNEMENFSRYYGQASPDSSTLGGWGHFTQLVWKSTFAIGCATHDCSSSGGLKGVGGNVPPYFTVCNYNYTGNVYPQFNTNVFRPLGHPYAAWNSGVH